AGFGVPTTFVAPYDQVSKESLQEISARFKVLSTGWFEIRRLPWSWLPNYAVKKTLQRYHWEAGGTRLLAHPGCHLSYHKDYGTMLDTIISSIQSRRLTVLVSHWWEYFRSNLPDEKFINVLHETAEYLASQKDIQVISFEDVANGKIALN
ncbi:MAG: hypothetical protein JWN25_309, partial [Verrucomicrobiales bacterium]|nr:hypothetical protein [Verrucomicrobiales bacterium]